MTRDTDLDSEKDNIRIADAIGNKTRQDVMKWRRGRAPRVGRWLAAKRQAAHNDAELQRRLLRERQMCREACERLAAHDDVKLKARRRQMWVEAAERAIAFKESRYPTRFSPFELPK